MERLTREEREAGTDLLYDWRLRARESQLEPEGDWWIWLVQTGRGWGKTRTALETVRARLDSGQARTCLVAAPTWGDVMDTIVAGSQYAVGLMDLWPPHRRPVLRRSQDDPHLKTWNGAKIRLRAAQRADRFRGPNNDLAYLDELDAWKPEGMTAAEAFGIAEMSVRTGPDPRIIATSTPKRGRLVAELRKRNDVHVTTGRMAENLGNLHPRFVELMEAKYGGTRLGRQELEGELLEEVEGALVTPVLIEAGRRPGTSPADMRRIVVGVDPSGSVGGDRQGIVVVGRGHDGHGYVLADRSCSLRPEGWGRRVVETVVAFEADAVAVERNYGGDMAEHVIRQAAKDAGVTVRIVGLSASRGKHVRFEPVAALIEQERLHFTEPLPDLEDQVCAFTAEGYDGDGSPDAADAMVWAASELMLKPGLTPADLYGEGAEAVA